MAPFFKSSVLFSSFRRRHSHKPEKTSNVLTTSSSPPALHSQSLPNLEDLRGISARFFEELSPILQSRPVENSDSPVLSAHVSILSPGQSPKATSVSPCIDVIIRPSGTTITTLDSMTSLPTEASTSLAVSSCSSLATVRAAKIARRRAANIWSIATLPKTQAVAEMNEVLDQVEAMLCEKQISDNSDDDSDEKNILPDDCIYHERLISEINDKLYGLRNVYQAMQAEEQTILNENRSLAMQNERLNKELATNGDFKLLQKLDDQITKLKRTIDHIISTEMDVSVLRAANYSLQRGADASNALFLALRIAATNAPTDDPWSTIMGPQQIGYSHEEHVATTKRNAKLSDEIHLTGKKYRLWKLKAQMNAKYAEYTTPSSSAMSLLLQSLERAPKKWPENVNKILDKFEDDYEIKMRAVASPVGPSSCEKSPSIEVNETASPVIAANVVCPNCNTAIPPPSSEVVSSPPSPKPVKEVVPSAPLQETVLSPALSLKLVEAVVPFTLAVESVKIVLSPVLSPRLAGTVLPSAPAESAEVILSPALSLKPAEDILPSALSLESAEVVLSPAPSLELVEAASPSTLALESTKVKSASVLSLETVLSSALESAQVVLSPALSLKPAKAALPHATPQQSSEVVLPPVHSFENVDNEATSTTVKEPVEALPVTVSTEGPGQVIRRYIPGLKLFGGDGLGRAPSGLFGPPSDSENEVASRGSEHCTGSRDCSPHLNYPGGVLLGQCSAESSPGLEYIDEYPADGRRNPVLLQSDDSSNESVPTKNVVISGHGAPVRNSGYHFIEDYPTDGKRNPILRNCDDNSIKEVPRTNSLSNDEQIDYYHIDGRRNPVLRNDCSSEDLPAMIPASKLDELEQPKDKSILSAIARTASSSISDLKRIASASSSIKRSISSGLKRLGQINLKSRKDKPVSAGSRPTSSHQHQVSFDHPKENKMPRVKKQNVDKPIVPKPRTPAPSKGIHRSTISSALKAVDGLQPVKSAPKTARQKIVEAPVRRAPLTEVAACPELETNLPLSTRRKVLNQGRRAVRGIIRFVS